MALRDRLRRIERAARSGHYITIETSDGRTLHFSEQDQIDAYRSMSARVRALYRGEEIPPAHPLEAAARDAVHHTGPLARFVDVDGTAEAYWNRRRVVEERLSEQEEEGPHDT